MTAGPGEPRLPAPLQDRLGSVSSTRIISFAKWIEINSGLKSWFRLDSIK